MCMTTTTDRSARDQRSQRPQPRWAFDHHRLDAFHVALEAMVAVYAIADDLERGNAKLKDQMLRAVQGAYLQTSEAAARTGADRLARFRAARAEAGEAAAVLEGLERLGLADPVKVDRALELLWRLAAMLTRLAKIKRSSSLRRWGRGDWSVASSPLSAPRARTRSPSAARPLPSSLSARRPSPRAQGAPVFFAPGGIDKGREMRDHGPRKEKWRRGGRPRRQETTPAEAGPTLHQR